MRARIGIRVGQAPMVASFLPDYRVLRGGKPALARHRPKKRLGARNALTARPGASAEIPMGELPHSRPVLYHSRAIFVLRKPSTPACPVCI